MRIALFLVTSAIIAVTSVGALDPALDETSLDEGSEFEGRVLTNYGQTPSRHYPTYPQHHYNWHHHSGACRADYDGKSMGHEHYHFKLYHGIYQKYQCQKKCESFYSIHHQKCYGYEYSHGRCEVWKKPPLSYTAKHGFNCYVYQPIRKAHTGTRWKWQHGCKGKGDPVVSWVKACSECKHKAANGPHYKAYECYLKQRRQYHHSPYARPRPYGASVNVRVHRQHSSGGGYRRELNNYGYYHQPQYYCKIYHQAITGYGSKCYWKKPLY